MVLPVMFGRSIAVHSVRGGAAQFEFLELCDRPLGAADYMALAGGVHTLFLSGVPRMSLAVRRFRCSAFLSLPLLL